MGRRRNVSNGELGREPFGPPDRRRDTLRNISHISGRGSPKLEAGSGGISVASGSPPAGALSMEEDEDEGIDGWCEILAKGACRNLQEAWSWLKPVQFCLLSVPRSKLSNRQSKDVQ